MAPKLISTPLVASILLFSGASQAAITPSNLSIQYGDNFEDQDQFFIDLELLISDLGYINIGGGHANQSITASPTLKTDYFSLGFTSSGDSNLTLGLNYDYWELNNFNTHSYSASLIYYTESWSLGLHPEAHKITYSPLNRRSHTFDNIGAGISLGYFASDNVALYIDHYQFDFSANQPPPRSQLRISPLQRQVISSFDEKSSSVSVDYYFDKANIGMQYQQGTTAIYGDEYKVASFNGSLPLSEHWYTGISISHTHGSDDEFYSLNLGYSWE